MGNRNCHRKIVRNPQDPRDPSPVGLTEFKSVGLTQAGGDVAGTKKENGYQCLKINREEKKIIISVCT